MTNQIFTFGVGSVSIHHDFVDEKPALVFSQLEEEGPVGRRLKTNPDDIVGGPLKDGEVAMVFDTRQQAINIFNAILSPGHRPENCEAVRFGFDGHGWLYADNGSGSDWLERASRNLDAEPLYAATAVSDTRLVSLLYLILRDNPDYDLTAAVAASKGVQNIVYSLQETERRARELAKELME